jgi:Domain of unknown function (DUF1906)
MPTGFDTPADCSGQIPCIRHAGHAFVGRYLSKSSWKVIRKAEADTLRRAGLAIVLVYEDGPTTPSYFSFGRGQMDGARAANQAKVLDAPGNTTIYFAVDYDASEDDIDGVITQYFQGVVSSLRSFAAGGDADYRVGVYGSGATCIAMTAAGLVSMAGLCVGLARARQVYHMVDIAELAGHDLRLGCRPRPRCRRRLWRGPACSRPGRGSAARPLAESR